MCRVYVVRCRLQLCSYAANIVPLLSCCLEYLFVCDSRQQDVTELGSYPAAAAAAAAGALVPAAGCVSRCRGPAAAGLSRLQGATVQPAALGECKLAHVTSIIKQCYCSHSAGSSRIRCYMRYGHFAVSAHHKCSHKLHITTCHALTVAVLLQLACAGSASACS
jgi:hypothetical protein